MTSSICVIVVVIKEHKPIISALLSIAALMISSLSISLPKSITLKPLFSKSADTIFLPKSWISPFTVAMTIVPLLLTLSAGIRSLILMKASRIASADNITCGKKIFFAPKSLPTTFIAALKALSVISFGLCPSVKACSTI